MNVTAIIQARTGSSRLPNKIFYKLIDKPLLYHVVQRLKPSKELTDIIVATTISKNDDQIELWCYKNNIKCYRGSEDNVLERYFKAAIFFGVDIVVRITADDPFKDYEIIDNAVRILKEQNFDFVSNNNPVSFPEGLDVEVFTREVLNISYKNASSSFEKEHVTQYVYKNKAQFKVFNIFNDENLSHHRWTIDTLEDYKFVKKIYQKLYKENKIFNPQDIYNLLKQNPELSKINSSIKKSDLYR